MKVPQHVLLVDDDDIFNMLHGEVLKRLIPDVRIDIFKSGVEVSEYLQKETESAVDLIFLDIRMPVMGGFEVLDLMATMNPDRFKNTRIYVLSSTLDDRDLQRAKATPLVTDFIGKPMSFDTMRSILGQTA
ncbi:MAG: response regulator [Flavobacteriales bacterium]|jgi:two-component system chemotaxis response regulator CheY